MTIVDFLQLHYISLWILILLVGFPGVGRNVNQESRVKHR
jgi:hypothetical protein